MWLLGSSYHGGNVQCIIEPECLELRVPLSTLTVPFPQNSLPLGALKTEDWERLITWRIGTFSVFKCSHLSVPCIWSPFFIKVKVELENPAPNPKHYKLFSNLSHPAGILRLNPIFPVHSPCLWILACISMQSTLFLISNLSHWLFLRLRLIFADHIFYISLPPVSASLMLLPIPLVGE